LGARGRERYCNRDGPGGQNECVVLRLVIRAIACG
jgi:hypothetical protein